MINKHERNMKKALITSAGIVLLGAAMVVGAPTKVHAHADFVATIGRMVTVVPPAVVRGGLHLVEGALDGLIEGLFARKGFLHGESRYL